MKIKVRDNKITFKHDGKTILKGKRGERYWQDSVEGRRTLALCNPEMAALHLLHGYWEVPLEDMRNGIFHHLMKLKRDRLVTIYDVLMGGIPGARHLTITYEVHGGKAVFYLLESGTGTVVSRGAVEYTDPMGVVNLTGNKNYEALGDNVFLVHRGKGESWLLAGDRALAVCHKDGCNQTVSKVSKDVGKRYWNLSVVEAFLAFELQQPGGKDQEHVVRALLKRLIKNKAIKLNVAIGDEHISYMLTLSNETIVAITVKGLSTGNKPVHHIGFRAHSGFSEGFTLASLFNLIDKTV